MKMMRLGKTNYKVNKNGFGALPIQRRNKKDSIEIIQKHMIMESISMILPVFIQTVRKN